MARPTRKKLALMTLAVSTLSVLALALMMFRSPASAEENLGEHSFVNDIGSYKYVTYLYPNLNQEFYLPPGYETRFDIHNAKFYRIDYYEHVGQTRAGLEYSLDLNSPHFCTLRASLEFFTPRGELIKGFPDQLPNWWWNVPHNLTSLEYDHLQVRIRNHSKYNIDFRFLVMDPVDAVKGTPIPPPRDIHL